MRILWGGALVVKDEYMYQKIREVYIHMGPNMDPHQAYMVLRGIKTLAVRMERAQANAKRIAKHLEEHPKINWVKYPGLPSHPQHELAKRQMSGYGSMISFGVKGDLEAGRTLMNCVEVATLAVSLGGVETLIQHPASMTHGKVPREARHAAGISDELVRYSVGIEDCEDLIEDLDQALAKVVVR